MARRLRPHFWPQVIRRTALVPNKGNPYPTLVMLAWSPWGILNEVLDPASVVDANHPDFERTHGIIWWSTWTATETPRTHLRTAEMLRTNTKAQTTPAVETTPRSQTTPVVQATMRRRAALTISLLGAW
ncbi:hypothetical protein CcaverHIS631_0102780 [Cutaneotrichosporon cavernicola]|nr:hypothetical protein CcaverHIS631_0102780 [Cutaneotrichosporon cavernicola]BEJ03103.1 hypothetical protein CcaverHIS641_0102780 [Cutaneotrichosporon cavernicola]